MLQHAAYFHLRLLRLGQELSKRRNAALSAESASTAQSKPFASKRAWMKRLFSNENVPVWDICYSTMNLFSAKKSPIVAIWWVWCESGPPWALNSCDSAQFFALLQCMFTGCVRAARKGVWEHWGSVFSVRTSLLLHCCGVWNGVLMVSVAAVFGQYGRSKEGCGVWWGAIGGFTAAA